VTARAVALLAALLLTVAAGVVLIRPGGDREGAARAAAERFFDGYMGADGRVTRHDQGGDTVSEGQAYAMLLAVATRDEKRFDVLWRWTRAHLLRDDGLLAWRWADGHVVDAEPAADADLDAARALLLAARRFDRPGYGRAGRELGRAIRAHMTAGDVLVAGPWARAEGVVNPSYFSPRAYDALGWEDVAGGSRRVLGSLGRRLPPDWARADGEAAAATGPPNADEPPAYGYDAVRLPLRLAESCSETDRELAARAWPALRSRDPLPAVLELDGRPRAPGSHPAALAGAAGAAHAAGDEDSARELLDRAGALERRTPSYYGAAWVALGRVMLETGWLGGC
jgi:endoglucanase